MSYCSEMTEGELLSINGLILEVCKVVDYQYSYCVGFKKKALCRKLSDCSNTSGTFYFRKLKAFEVRRVKKAKKSIKEI